MRLVLVLNAGSSSVKFGVYERSGDADLRLAAQGQVEGFGVRPRLVATDDAGAALVDQALRDDIRDPTTALDALTAWLFTRFDRAALGAIGHRVVHGGERFRRPTLLTPEIVDDLRRFSSLAPLHQPYSLAAIDGAFERLPGVAQVACFDTAFHRTHDAVARLMPLPAHLRERGLQRYGFHGISYEYIASVLPDTAPEIASGRVLVLHLGSGASVCAMRNRESVDTSLGFTALDGLCMGTRPGALDPGVVLHFFQQMGMRASEVEDVLYRQSGLLGISGVSNDMRVLLASDEPAAALAVDYFVYRAAKEVGAMASTLGGLDGLVFTAGIGERAAEVRRRICEACAWLGVRVDEAANDAHGPRITTPDSEVSAWVIPTNEALMIARHTAALTGGG